ncbi:MAG: LruC domain-containing protein [Candidatus Cloacimonadaceae bacterium]|nr:LruC domain-containing protein [Candidatus Cloacimonadaceae bacterium]
MRHIIKIFLMLALISIVISGCDTKKDDNVFIPVNDLVVADGFNWQTSREVEISLEVQTNTGEPVSNVVFELFASDPTAASDVIAKGATAASGKYETTISIPSHIKKIWAVGFMSTIELPIVNNKASHTYGGFIAQPKGGAGFYAPESKNWSFLPGMTFNSQGVPSPMTNDVLTADFLQRINATLPESMPVPLYHPHYMDPANQTNIKIDELAEVWVTFVHEGAGFKNALGFHTYPSDNTPQTTAEVGTKTLIFPNASLSGSGGGLVAGNKVYLGIFQPETTIGWLLVANGYVSSNGGNVNVSTTAPVYYSNIHLNPESDPNKKKHSILVYDDITERLLIGFEDLPRMSGSDDDFNDVVFYVTVNPIEAVDTDGIPPMDIPEDRDGDGISDLFDDYPDDPELAFNNYTFGPNSWGTLAFEDLWPNKGDYDFNDMVLDYNYNQITKAGNVVRKVEMSFVLRAIGARKSNGFAVQLPFASSNINILQTSHPALFEHETDGPKAVLRFFNSSFDLIPQQANSFINTEIDKPYYQPVAFSATFWVNNPVPIANVSPTPPYNPFIFVDGVRSHEVHLSGFAPTHKMNTALFGTGDDNSIPAQNRYYKTSNNLPWAVNIAASWDYPIEKAQITRAFNKFKDWAQSSGNSYPDWYLNLPGYRNNEYIYQTP